MKVGDRVKIKNIVWCPYPGSKELIGKTGEIVQISGECFKIRLDNSNEEFHFYKVEIEEFSG